MTLPSSITYDRRTGEEISRQEVEVDSSELMPLMLKLYGKYLSDKLGFEIEFIKMEGGLNEKRC